MKLTQLSGSKFEVNTVLFCQIILNNRDSVFRSNRSVLRGFPERGNGQSEPEKGLFSLRRVLPPIGSWTYGVRQYRKWGWSSIDETNLRNRSKNMCSGETDMNLWGSLPNHENHTIFDEAPYQGLFRGTAGRFFFELFVPDPPRGRPFAGRRQSS